MTGLFARKSVRKVISLGLISILAAGLMTGCGKKEEKKFDTAAYEKLKEEAAERNRDRTDDLIGVWQLNADTPAGDPYVFQLEVDKDKNMSYSGYSMAGDNWFQNFCYDGIVENFEMMGIGEDTEQDITNDYEDGSFDIQIELSELDYNGTETDRIECVYNVKPGNGADDSIVFKHISGRYIGPEDTDSVTFIKVDEAIGAGDLVTEDSDESESDWRYAYWTLLSEFQNEPFDSYKDYSVSLPDSIELLDVLDGKNAVSYYLYDMDDDSIDELIIIFETSDEDSFGLFCRAEGGTVYGLGGYPMDYTDLYSDPDNDGVIAQKADMGTSVIDRLTIGDEFIESQNISVEYYNGHGEPVYDHAPDVIKGAKLLRPRDIKNIESLRLGTEGVEPSSEQIRLLEEAITIFPVNPMYVDGYDLSLDISNVGYEVLGNWNYNADNQAEYAGLSFDTGREKTPNTVFSAYGYFDAGDMADYIRTDKDMLESALQGFFDTDTCLGGVFTSYDSVVDDNYVTLWGDAYKEAFFENNAVEWCSFKNHMDGDTLIIDAMRQDENSIEIRNDAMRFYFYQNPDSFYGYTLIDYEIINTKQSAKFTLDQIKDTEKFIRGFVNGNSKDKEKVSLKAGTDGCPYARDFYYISGSPIFAYYYSATDGSCDNRYYFECDYMVEWIEGNGNDDSNRERHYSCDSPLDSRWKITEKTVLSDAKYYGETILGHYYD